MPRVGSVKAIVAKATDDGCQGIEYYRKRFLAVLRRGIPQPEIEEA
jgi:hypothetical protein